MEEQNTNEKPSKAPTTNADVGHEAPPTATAGGGGTTDDADPGDVREARKRKESPIVDKCETLVKKKKSPLNSSYSFTFDTKIWGGSGFASTPESTPKFGSFNLAASAVINGKEKAAEEEEEKLE